MKWTVLLVFIAKTLACPTTEPTTIQIQNYDGPIFLHIPAQNDETCPQSPTYQQAEIECTCIAKPSLKYIPINTASESSCHNRNGYRNCNNGCTCGSFNGGKHCGTCTCGNDNGSNDGACTCGNNNCRSCSSNSRSDGYCSCGSSNSRSCSSIGNGCCTRGSYDSRKHCKTCTCESSPSENSSTCTCSSNNCSSCTYGRNSGSCTCGSNNGGSCTCRSKSISCTCETKNEGFQSYNEPGYKGIDEIYYTLDIVKPCSYNKDYNNCICHKRTCY